jgi:hypothetical protein
MSKKQKINRKVNKPVLSQPNDNKPGSVPTIPPVGIGSSNLLIHFDKKAKLFLLIMVALYVIMSSLKLHTSSIGNWNTFIGAPESESVLAGTPKFIRMDEWMSGTPAIIGQYQTGMPLNNIQSGDGNAPLIYGFPVKDFTMILRPSLWPYFIFDVEHAFAFSWNFYLFFFVISTFLLFMLLTANKFWLSVFGAFFIFLSGAEQWWSYWLGTYMIYLNGMFVSTIYLLYSKNLKALFIAAVIFLFSSFSFLNGLYPPWQVPLIYLYLFVFVGYILKIKNFKIIKEKALLRAGVISITGILLLFFVYHYFTLAKDTFTLLANTAYPGKRTTNGGDLSNAKLFSEFFGMYMSDQHFPEKWQNICEASSFIMFFPIIYYGMGYNFIRFKKFDWLQFLIAFYIIILLTWLVVGFPTFLSKLSLLSMSPAYRTLPVFGVVNAFLLISYLGNKETDNKTIFSWLEFAILVITIYIFTRIVASNINKATSDFFSSDQISLMSALITVVYLLIRYKFVKYTGLIVGILLIGMTISNIGVNPLTQGLSALLENPLSKVTNAIHKKDPKARWAVFGDKQWIGSRWANLLKVNGIAVFNGVKFTPIIKEMTLAFDSSGKDRDIYNRYAHVDMGTYINWNDTVVLNQASNDGYVIFMDPCSPRLKKLEISYVLFTYKPQDTEIRCMTRMDSTFFIYKRIDK